MSRKRYIAIDSGLEQMTTKRRKYVHFNHSKIATVPAHYPKCAEKAEEER